MKNQSPLEGIKVLDFTHVLSGSYGTMLLGDLGADILKVEKLGYGDSLRNTPPLKNGQSAYFFCSNRSKRCLEIDLKKPGATEIIYRLVKNCDVFAENFRPKVMDRLGLGYENIKKIRPDIIYASLSAFGEKGPYVDKPGFELIIQSMAGLVDVTSPTQGRPSKVQPQVVDICGGMFMAIAILGALFHRQKTGEGQRITTSLLEGLFALMTNFIYMHLMGSKISKGLGTRNPMMFPSQAFKTKDGYISVVVVPGHWDRFCKALDKLEWLDDENYSNVVYRVKHYDKMEKLVEEVTKNKSTQNWQKIFEKHQVAASKIDSVEDMFENPQIKALDLLLNMNHQKAGEVKIQNIPWQMSQSQLKVRYPPPALGEHTRQLLNENGFTKKEIDKLIKDKIVAETYKTI